MRVALMTTFAASKKEPLAIQLERVHQAFADAGLHPAIRFNFGDAAVPGFVSSVDRVLKRYPDLARFVTASDPMPGIPGARRITNGPSSPAAGEGIAYETLSAIAAGVPRSFPFHSVKIHWFSDEFGSLGDAAPKSAGLLPGILLGDTWWVNGRKRSLSACTVLDVEPGARRLPALPERLSALFAACGKVKRTIQAPIPDSSAAPGPGTVAGIPLPANRLSPQAGVIRPVVADYRSRMAAIAAQAALPHDLPPQSELPRPDPAAISAGPRKPALEAVFKPMGYACKGGAGTFTLRRRTASNLTVEVSIDVGTWSHSVTAFFLVTGIGFKAALRMPVSARALAGAQYQIGDAERWSKIAENLGALTRELDRTFVPHIERAAGPSPEWYQPEA